MEKKSPVRDHGIAPPLLTPKYIPVCLALPRLQINRQRSTGTRKLSQRPVSPADNKPT
jgi:molybdate-binding protein